MKKIILLVTIFVASFTANAQILLDEGFEDVALLLTQDYIEVNASDDPNNGWLQGPGNSFQAYDGDPTAFLAASWQTTSGGPVIDLWGIWPLLELKNGDIFSFYTRTVTESTFPDRLEVRIDPDGSGTLPTNGDPGSYTELLLSINPNLELGGYPEVWTLQTITISGLPVGTTSTRVALRYWATDAGPTGFNANLIGIDRAVVESIVLGIEDLSFEDFNYYVANNQLNLSANTSMEKVVLYNILGQHVVSQKLSSNNETVSLSGLQTGIYIAIVSINGASKSFKIAKN